MANARLDHRRAQLGGRRGSAGEGWTARLCCGVLLVVVLCALLAQAAGAETGTEKAERRLGYSLSPSATKPYTPCPPGGRVVECNIVIDPAPARTPSGFRPSSGGPLYEGGGELGGYDPTDLQSAYGIPASGGTGETVALVDAYGYAAAESDLAKYREKYGLSACTKANGCFKKVNQKGEEKNYPAEGGEIETIWSLEAALDLDMVSAACPNCHIMLVEATTQEPKDTAASVEEAATLKATEISNSYGYAENNETLCPGKKGCKEYLSAYNHAGIPVTVSTGDSGFDGGGGAPSWPATSPNVIAVGGTSLNKAEGSRGWAEKVWSGAGSGCSLYESKPAWQSDTACTMRMDSDVAAVADPNTPVSAYNTPSVGGWFDIGGTSVAAPLMAGIEAHANSATKTASAEGFYKHPGMLFDVTKGSNGSCSAEDAYFCHGEVGYDGPTGWGTPNGVPHLNGWFPRPVSSLATRVESKNSLSSTACGASECVAVGHYTNNAGAETALIEPPERLGMGRPGTCYSVGREKQQVFWRGVPERPLWRRVHGRGQLRQCRGHRSPAGGGFPRRPSVVALDGAEPHRSERQQPDGHLVRDHRSVCRGGPLRQQRGHRSHARRAHEPRHKHNFDPGDAESDGCEKQCFRWGEVSVRNGSMSGGGALRQQRRN